jgi:hypothetical protein
VEGKASPSRRARNFHDLTAGAGVNRLVEITPQSGHGSSVLMLLVTA